MGDGDRKRVGNVIGFRSLAKAENFRHHKLHLCFLGVSDPHHGLFDLGG
jgi:hypothetical protein